MKIKKVTINRRKKCFEVYTKSTTYDYPFSQFQRQGGIQEVWVDRELAGEGFTFRYEDGTEESVLLDQVREYAGDPAYIREMLLYKLTVYAQKALANKGVKKREVIRRMGTSPTQFYRLMDQTNTRKSLDEMVRLLAALDVITVDVVTEEAA